MGLIPIGMNPHTLLWEFYHLRSACDPEWDTDPGDAPIPEHDSDGWIDVAEATGVVFVLVPGGTFTMGAQSTDPEAPNHDPRAADNEAPAHTMTLAPFFLARHELTQGQWLRLSGEDNPSYYEPGELGVNLSHPVEEIDWTSSDELMRHHGLLLPTEAQWEYGCRAGTATAWWTGEDRESLILDGLAANLADQAAARAGVKWASIKDWPELDDGFAAHAPVDAMRPNPWGLHLVHGNLWEWCSDRRAPYESEAAPGDGLRDAPGVAARVNRGGSFHSDTRYARSSFRSSLAASTRSSTLGMRAARRLAP
jgi:formylglycine-generating enzyme required for sulfatase activity